MVWFDLVDMFWWVRWFSSNQLKGTFPSLDNLTRLIFLWVEWTELYVKLVYAFHQMIFILFVCLFVHLVCFWLFLSDTH
jgi:ABC-type protease/lipase transport system fused ATPase/permease subunit